MNEPTLDDLLMRYARAREAETRDLKRLRDGDFELTRALASDVGIPITAPDTQPGAQWEQFHRGVTSMATRLRDALLMLEVALSFAQQAREKGLNKGEGSAHCLWLSIGLKAIQEPKTKPETKTE